MFSEDPGKGTFLANLLIGCVLCLAIMAACLTPGPVAAESPSPGARTGAPVLTVRETPQLVAAPAPCILATLVMPPTPAKIPGYTEIDPSTGLHVTGGFQEIDLKTYRLEVTGKVARPLSITYDELRCMPRVEARPTLICPGFFSDVATWAGTPLKYLMGLAQPTVDATALRLFGADRYTASLSLQDATADGNFLAYEWEGKALPRLHGFPVRAVLPKAEGNQWVKWLIRIEVY